MKKLFALLMAVVMMLALSATAFADTWGYLEWDEEHQQYKITLRGDDDDDFNPYGNIQYPNIERDDRWDNFNFDDFKPHDDSEYLYDFVDEFDF